MNKVKEYFNTIKNDHVDPRKNDLWRILLFALNNSGGVSVMHILGKWSYYTQNVLQLGIFLTSVVSVMSILDAVTDPLIANLFDKFESKHGKYRPFMLVGGLMSFVPALVIFCYPVNTDIPLWVSYTILTIMYAIIVVGNTIVMTVTRAGQAIITQDPHQRPIYALGQTVFDAIIMGFVSIVITSNLVGNMQDAFVWRFAIIVLSAVSMILIVIAMKAISTRDNPRYYSLSKSKEPVKISEFLELIKRSSALRRLIAATVSDSVAASIRASLTIYLFANIIMQRSLSATFDIISSVALGAPVVLIGVFLATKKGSSAVYTKISVLQTFVSLLGFVLCLVFLPADPERTYSGLTFSVIIVLLVFGVYMSTLGVSSNLVTSMTGDLADYEYFEHGKFIPGIIGATLTFVKKMVGSVFGLLTTGIMLFCGFSSSGEASVVPENVFVNYRFYYCVLCAVFILPAIGHLITYIAMKKYPVTDKKMEEISQIMAKDRGMTKDEETVEV